MTVVADQLALDLPEVAYRPPRNKIYRTDLMLLLARSNAFWRQVNEGEVDGPLALSYVVWPTRRMVEAELKAPSATLASRAFAARLNP